MVGTESPSCLLERRRVSTGATGLRGLSCRSFFKEEDLHFSALEERDLAATGIVPESTTTTKSIYNAALALGIANQLTNILRDVGEDASRGRIYLPQDELAQAGLSDEDVFNGKVTDRWRSFMKSQIKRARTFFQEAEKGVTELSQASRWPVKSISLFLSFIILMRINQWFLSVEPNIKWAAKTVATVIEACLVNPFISLNRVAFRALLLGEN